MYTTTALFPASLDVYFHPLGVPLVMTFPAESIGRIASVLPFAPVKVGAIPAPSALSVALLQFTLPPAPVMLTVALLT
jgi:hypothetical protein